MEVEEGGVKVAEGVEGEDAGVVFPGTKIGEEARERGGIPVGAGVVEAGVGVRVLRVGDAVRSPIGLGESVRGGIEGEEESIEGEELCSPSASGK